MAMIMLKGYHGFFILFTACLTFSCPFACKVKLFFVNLQANQPFCYMAIKLYCHYALQQHTTEPQDFQTTKTKQYVTSKLRFKTWHDTRHSRFGCRTWQYLAFSHYYRRERRCCLHPRLSALHPIPRPALHAGRVHHRTQRRRQCNALLCQSRRQAHLGNSRHHRNGELNHNTRLLQRCVRMVYLLPFPIHIRQCPWRQSLHTIRVQRPCFQFMGTIHHRHHVHSLHTCHHNPRSTAWHRDGIKGPYATAVCPYAVPCSRFLQPARCDERNNVPLPPRLFQDNHRRYV